MKSVYHSLMQGCGWLAAFCIGLVALLVSADVLARNLGIANFAWVVEVSEYSLPLATFLAAPWLLYRNEHVRLDMLLIALPPPLARRLQRGADLLGLLVCLLLTGYGLRVVLESKQLGSQVMKTLVFPEWWLFVPVPLCFALLSLEFLRRLFTQPIRTASA